MDKVAEVDTRIVDAIVNLDWAIDSVVDLVSSSDTLTRHHSTAKGKLTDLIVICEAIVNILQIGIANGRAALEPGAEPGALELSADGEGYVWR